jgi:hypothetical protein
VSIIQVMINNPKQVDVQRKSKRIKNKQQASPIAPNSRSSSGEMIGMIETFRAVIVAAA